MNKPESEVAAAVETLFRRLPALVGFSVRPGELALAHVATHPSAVDSRELLGQIIDALRELTDDEPAARELLLGRTFARTLH